MKIKNEERIAWKRKNKEIYSKNINNKIRHDKERKTGKEEKDLKKKKDEKDERRR